MVNRWSDRRVHNEAFFSISVLFINMMVRNNFYLSVLLPSIADSLLNMKIKGTQSWHYDWHKNAYEDS